jgi:hypothetical protein
MKGKGPLASYEDNIKQFVQMSLKFKDGGDPRTWADVGVVWPSDETREWSELAYDEWASGAWNHIDGVVKPTE